MTIIIIAIGMLHQKSFSAGPSYILGLGKAFVARGCRLIVITSCSGAAQLTRLGLSAEFWLIDRKERLNEPPLVFVPFIMVTRMFQAALLLWKKKPERGTTVFASSNLLWEIFPLLFVKTGSAARIATFHMGYPSPFRGYHGAFTSRKKLPTLRETLAYFQHKLALPCLKYGSDIIIAHTNMSYLLLEYGIPPEKIAPMDVGVAWDIIDSIAAPVWQYDACWVGRYNPQKGCSDLLEIWEKVIQTRPAARLAVMGNVAIQLQPIAEQKGLMRNIDFIGPVSEEDKFRVMKASSLLIFPSYYEAVPLSVIEAMACKLPVVAYDLPVYQTHFPRGIIKVSIGNKKALAEAVVNLLADTIKRSRLADEAVSLAREYNWDKAATRFLSIVQMVAD